MTNVERVSQALRRIAVVAAFAVALVLTGTPIGGEMSGVAPAIAQQEGQVPGNTLGGSSDADFWRAIREGQSFSVSIPDKKAATLVQSEGDNWRAWRNGPVSVIGAWVVLGFIAFCALFFAIRGRVRIDAGPSGMTMERFNGIERFTHWLTAGSFIILALSGLNLLYGKYVLLPVIGPEAFSALSTAGKYAHNFLAFPFMLGLVLMFFLWVAHNIPNKYDMIWLARGGGLFTKGSHPPSKKFNAGQKIIFWITILGGLTLSVSGIALMFPFEFAPWAATFGALNAIGFSLPTDLTPIQEMQLSQLWHAVTSLIIIGIIIAHIYIGSVGMEGAFAAMGTGMVDENWAREHHNLWVAEVKGEPMMAGGHGDD
ncbi:MAG: formate dehydrogenase subunit gamma [Alphaproteobacteria bacterium]|nr:formate dehydrogenase subunit gamma [Alphaproteobacteria bacterium]